MCVIATLLNGRGSSEGGSRELFCFTILLFSALSLFTTLKSYLHTINNNSNNDVEHLEIGIKSITHKVLQGCLSKVIGDLCGDLICLGITPRLPVSLLGVSTPSTSSSSSSSSSSMVEEPHPRASGLPARLLRPQSWTRSVSSASTPGPQSTAAC